MTDTPDQTPAEEFADWLGARKSTTPGSSTHASETTPLDEAASDLDSSPAAINAFMNTPITGGAPSASPGETFANFLAAALNKGA